MAIVMIPSDKNNHCHDDMPRYFDAAIDFSSQPENMLPNIADIGMADINKQFVFARASIGINRVK